MSGQRGERVAVDWLRSLGIAVVSHPGTPGFDDSGRGIEPDAGLLLGTGPTPRMMRGHQVDAWIEVKWQDRGGSVLDKLEYAIHRYATLSDQTGLPSALVYCFEPDAASPDALAYYQRLADVHLVALIRLGDGNATTLRSRLRELVRHRDERLTDMTEADRRLDGIGPEMAALLYRRSLHLRPTSPEYAYDALLA
jgi:hypothetical protein